MHERFMRLALEQAQAALTHHDVPVGAVVVRGDEVLSAAKNERELREDPTAHAETIALQQAARVTGSWRLHDCTLYVTLEPCPMCAGACVLASLPRLVYGASDPRAGAALSLYNIPQDPRLNHQVELVTGVLADESASLLQTFFGQRRGGGGI